MISLILGKKLVSLARRCLEKSFEKFEIEEVKEKELKKKRGVFVTLREFPSLALKGCIGFPYPSYPLYEAVQKAAFSSAFEDLRFSPLKKEELNKIVIEISILSKPKILKVKNPEEYFKKIKIGRDGLILKNGPFSGLLLPQVPLEMDWGVKEFLENLCYKANLTPDFIYDKNTKIWKFKAQIFYEVEPGGIVKELKLTKHGK
ncbi:MAG: TIGR00296 family protein [Candidatus Aenigmatarchaeota archaeon]